MADRYWVGGTGTWNASNTANWSASSGGASGASVPTSADNVFFDSASNATAYTVTIAVSVFPPCNDLTVTGPTSGSVTFQGDGNFVTDGWRIYCYGNVNLAATGIIFGAGIGRGIALHMLGAATGRTLTFNGNTTAYFPATTFSTSGIYFLGTGDVTVTGGINTAQITHTAGTLNTNGFTITSAAFTTSGTTTRTLTLGTSTITGGSWTVSGSNLTLSAASAIFSVSGFTSTAYTYGGTVSFSSISGSSIIFNGAVTVSGGGSIGAASNTFNSTVTFSAGGTISAICTFNGDVTFSGGNVTLSAANTFGNLIINAPAAAGLYTATLSANQIITGTLTASGASEIRRIMLLSDTLGTARTITAATYSPSHVDFRDITGAGAASPFVATTGGGDCGGNSGITFPSAKTVYWNLTGTQNWSATAWATTSGGTPALANFPLAQDTAIFNNTGAATTVTYNATWNAGTIDFSTRSSAVTFTVSNRITSYGDFILGSGVTYSGTAGITFSGNSKTMTLTSAGKTTIFGVVLNAYNGTLNLGDALTQTANSTGTSFTITQGTFSTQNYNHTITNTQNSGSIFVATGSLSRTINFGSSTLSYTNATNGNSFNVSGTNITINAGTSTLTVNNGANGTINFGTSLTFYNVIANFTNGSNTGTSTTFNTLTLQSNTACAYATCTNLIWSTSGAFAFTGTATNYTFNPTAAGSSITFAAGTKGNITVNNTVAGYFNLSLSGDLTLTGALTTTATNATMRTLIQSNTAGTTRTLTAASASLADVDFYWITGAGAASWTGTRLGNVGNNSGITTDTPKTVYWNLAGAQNWNATGWATSSGGSPAVNNYPLPQDTAVFDNTGSVTGNITMLTTPYYPTIDMSARTSAMTLVSAVANFSGGLKLGTGTTISGTSAFTFIGDNPAPIQCSGKTLANALTYSKVSGTVTQQDAFTSSTTVTLNNGTYNAANYNFTATSFSSSNSNTRAITMGTGTWTLTGTGTPWTLTTTTGLTFSGASSTIVYSDATNAATKIFAGGGLTYGTLTFGGGAATGQIFQLTGANTFNTLSHTKTVAFTIQFTAATTTTVSNWSISGTAGNLVTIGSVTAASHTLTKVGGVVSADYLSISRSTATPTSTWYAGTNSTNGGNNSGWTFTAPPGATYDITALYGSYTLSGQIATLLKSKNIDANNGTYVLTGQTATLLRSKLIVSDSGTYTITGQTADISKLVNYTITALNGSYAVTGQFATILRSKSIDANNGSYSVTGQSATLLRSKSIDANNGSYSLTGQSATLSRDLTLTANNGSYSVNGQSATLLRSKSISANNGSYSLNGQTALITRSAANNYDIIALYGSYNLTGQSATIARDRKLTANNGSYVVTGQSATLLKSKLVTTVYGTYAVTGRSSVIDRGRVLIASSGSYSLTGQSATISKTKVVLATNGVYNVNGQSANIAFSGAPVTTAEVPPIALRSLTERRGIDGY